MPKLALQSDKYGFTVIQEQLSHNGKVIPYLGNFRTDTNECLGITTDSYGLVQNTDLIKAAQDALASRGLTDYEERIIVAGRGERLYAEFIFKNKQLASAVGDVFGYGLRLKNSFDRSLRAAFELFFIRLTCLNGASTMEKEFSANSKHSSKVSVAFVGNAIDKAMAQGQDALKVYDQMAKVTISDEQGKTILGNLVEMNILSETLKQSIETLWLNPKRQEDKSRNLYNLYNAITEHLTHKVSATRYEYANKTNSNVLVTLVNAARNPSKFTKLILPVVKDTTIMVNTDLIVPSATPIIQSI